MNELIDYSEHAELLHKWAGQALAAIGKEKSEKELTSTVVYYKKDIARSLSEQIKWHSRLSHVEFQVRARQHVTPILTQSYTELPPTKVGGLAHKCASDWKSG